MKRLPTICDERVNERNFKDLRGWTHPFEVRLRCSTALRIEPDRDVMAAFLGVALRQVSATAIEGVLIGAHVDVLDDKMFRFLVPQQEPLVKFLSDVVDALVLAVHPLSDGLTDLLDQALHVHLLERRPDDDVREQVGRRQGHHDGRGDARERAVEVGRVGVAG